MTTYFHGGVSGLKVGTELKSSQALGVNYEYRGTTYDRTRVYLTSDLGVARSFAARYLDRTGRSYPGDVYEARPSGVLEADPDYVINGHYADVFVHCRSAKVIRVVEKNVQLTSQEQLKLESPYLHWGNPSRPMYSPTGELLPSPQMQENGVPRQWLQLIRPWTRAGELDGAGQLMCLVRSKDWSGVLDLVPSLDSEHQITMGAFGNFTCTMCGTSLSTTEEAIIHQLGEKSISLFLRVHRAPDWTRYALCDAAREKNPHRWKWLKR